MKSYSSGRAFGACVNFSIQGQKNGEIKRRWGARDAREYL